MFKDVDLDTRVWVLDWCDSTLVLWHCDMWGSGVIRLMDVRVMGTVHSTGNITPGHPSLVIVTLMTLLSLSNNTISSSPTPLRLWPHPSFHGDKIKKRNASLELRAREEKPRKVTEFLWRGLLLGIQRLRVDFFCWRIGKCRDILDYGDTSEKAPGFLCG